MKIALSFTTIGLCLFSSASALYLIDDVMSNVEQERTGVKTLNHNQRAELEKWLNENFVLKTSQQKQVQPNLSLAENINSGHMLKLSDGSVYEIAPNDVARAAGWITPFPIELAASGDPNYPYKIINKNSGASLRARLFSGPNNTGS